MSIVDSIYSSIDGFVSYVRDHLAASDYDLFIMPGECGVGLTLIDFEGFDDDWGEIYREYENGTAICALIDMMDANFERYDAAAYYRRYVMNGFVVTVGFTSDDI